MADTNEATKGGIQSQQGLYSKIASRQEEIIQTLFELLKSRNEGVAVSAAKTLLNKILPDLRSTEITGKNGEPIKLNIIAGADYLSSGIQSVTSSTGSTTYRSTPIQSTSVASESKKDDNSNKSASEVDPA